MIEESERLGVFQRPWLANTDERTYAAFRIAFAFVAFVNVVILWPYRELFFVEGGMIDAAAIKNEGWYGYLSFFHWIDSGWAVTLMFIGAALAIVCLGLGVAPRLCAVLVFIWHISFTYRVIPGCAGWDYLLRAYSFLVMVSPLGRCWAWPRGVVSPSQVPIYGLTLMRLQMAVVYLQTALLKFADEYWQSGEFMAYFLLSSHARWPHPNVADMSEGLGWATHLAHLTEVAIPILLFIPRTRFWGVVVGFGFHLAIAILGHGLTMFSVVMWMTYVAFLDAPTMNRLRGLGRWLARK